MFKMKKIFASKRDKIKARYTFEKGKAVIDLQLENMDQLFDKKDPNPFRRRDLDEDAAAYIVESVEELGRPIVGKIRIKLFESISEELLSSISESIVDYFSYQSGVVSRKVDRVLRIGFKSLGIGLFFLSLAIFVNASMSQVASSSYWHDFLKESCLLFGWVSMWKPIETFLYDWWPHMERKRTFDLLKNIEIEFLCPNSEGDYTVRGGVAPIFFKKVYS